MIHELIATSLKPFLERVEAKLQKLVPLFKKARFRFRDGLGTVTEAMLRVPMSNITYVGPGEEIVITLVFIGYQGEAPTPFDLEVSVGIHFPPGKYTITHDGQVIASHDYSTLVLAEEADRLSSQILAAAFDSIKRSSRVKE
jgi:hypothetical protein